MSIIHRPETAAPPGAAHDRLTEGRAQFIELWGHMASSWGVPRSMAEIHALLFIEGRPMNADEIMARLSISRGNASMTLRTLMEWGIVAREHCKIDRKDYFAAEQDVRTLFSTVICARKKREIDPLLGRLNACRETTELRIGQDAAPEMTDALNEHNRKLDQMLDFVQGIDFITTRFLSGDGRGLDMALDTLKRVP